MSNYSFLLYQVVSIDTIISRVNVATISLKDQYQILLHGLTEHAFSQSFENILNGGTSMFSQILLVDRPSQGGMK